MLRQSLSEQDILKNIDEFIAFFEPLKEFNWHFHFKEIEHKFYVLVHVLLPKLSAVSQNLYCEKIKPYIEKFFKDCKQSAHTYNFYAWFLELNLPYCQSEEHKKSLVKIKGIYEEYLKKFTSELAWPTRINYLNFCSRKLSSTECIDLAKKFLKDCTDNYFLAIINHTLAIEYEKCGNLNKLFYYANESIKNNDQYSPAYSSLGKCYRALAEIYFKKGNPNEANKYIKLAEENFDKAKQLNPNRFIKKHKLVGQQSTKQITELALSQYFSQAKLKKSSNITANSGSSLSIVNVPTKKIKVKQTEKIYSEEDFKQASFDLLFAQEKNAITPMLVRNLVNIAEKTNHQNLAARMKKDFPLFFQSNKKTKQHEQQENVNIDNVRRVNG